MAKFGVYIGRFQPLHNAHLHTILEALKQVEKLIIIIGSTTSSKSIKNPWTSLERQELILGALKYNNIDSNRIIFINAVDYLYNDNLWTTALQTSIYNIVGDNTKDVILFGHDKDKSTFYLKLFPGWIHIDFGSHSTINATQIRKMFFESDFSFQNYVPPNVALFLKKEFNTIHYNDLVEEYNFIKNYKQQWDSSPYPPVFVTTDAIVIKSGHILVVRRKASPGRGLIALPGGFLGQNDSIIESCIRELKEETGICLPKDELKKRIVDQRVFDHPERSLRGRTITHAFCFNLGHGELPRVKGSDDAEHAWWMSLRDCNLNEQNFYEDHYHIVQYFVNKF